MMPGIRVVTDSSADLPSDLVAKYGIEIVPLTIRFGNEEFVDVQDLSPEGYWERCRASAELPETSAPAPGAFLEAFQRAASDGCEGVVCVTISSGLSATYQSAISALGMGEEVSIPVEVVDSRYVTLAQGFVTLAAAEAAASGASLNEVRAAAEGAVGRTHAIATLDTLDNLRRLGRIGGAQALLGSVLNIKPMIHLVNGVVEPESRQRTRSRALAHLVDVARSKGSPELIGIAHGDAGDIESVTTMVRDAFPGVEIVTSFMGPVIGTHTGVGTIVLVTRTPADGSAPES